jgi:hypothetical protein
MGTAIIDSPFFRLYKKQQKKESQKGIRNVKTF